MTEETWFPCRPSDKRPYTRHGFKSASSDPRQHDEWLWRFPDCLKGQPVRLGEFVVDVDPRHGGDVTLAELLEVNGPLPQTRRTRTRSGGEHWWLSADVEVRQDSIGKYLGAGLDVRVGGKGYVIVPDSPGYTWIDNGPVRPAPAWLVAKLAVPPAETRTSSTVPSGPSKGYGAAALRKECETVASIPVGLGQRNHGLYLAAVRMGTLVGAHVLDEYTVAQALLAATSLPAGEAETTILSGLNWGADHPRQVRT